LLLVGRTHMKPEFHEKQHFAASHLTVEHGSTIQWTVEPCSTVAVHYKVRSSFFFFNFEKPVCYTVKSLGFFKKKSVQLIDFTHTIHVNMNNIFLLKNSLRWIKFTRTVIPILFLIIFYLILLHAQKIWKL